MINTEWGDRVRYPGGCPNVHSSDKANKQSNNTEDARETRERIKVLVLRLWNGLTSSLNSQLGKAFNSVRFKEQSIS